MHNNTPVNTLSKNYSGGFVQQSEHTCSGLYLTLPLHEQLTALQIRNMVAAADLTTRGRYSELQQNAVFQLIEEKWKHMVSECRGLKCLITIVFMQSKSGDALILKTILVYFISVSVMFYFFLNQIQR